MAPYQDYKEFMGRFVSEFGFESAPSELRFLFMPGLCMSEHLSQYATFPALRSLWMALPGTCDLHWMHVAVANEPWHCTKLSVDIPAACSRLSMF